MDQKVKSIGYKCKIKRTRIIYKLPRILMVIEKNKFLIKSQNSNK